VSNRLAPTDVHDDGHGAPIRHLLLPQQIGRGAAALRPSIHQWRASVTPWDGYSDGHL